MYKHANTGTEIFKLTIRHTGTGTMEERQRRHIKTQIRQTRTGKETCKQTPSHSGMMGERETKKNKKKNTKSATQTHKDRHGDIPTDAKSHGHGGIETKHTQIMKSDTKMPIKGTETCKQTLSHTDLVGERQKTYTKTQSQTHKHT